MASGQALLPVKAPLLAHEVWMPRREALETAHAAAETAAADAATRTAGMAEQLAAAHEAAASAEQAAAETVALHQVLPGLPIFTCMTMDAGS